MPDLYDPPNQAPTAGELRAAREAVALVRRLYATPPDTTKADSNG